MREEMSVLCYAFFALQYNNNSQSPMFFMGLSFSFAGNEAGFPHFASEVMFHKFFQIRRIKL